MFAIRRLPVSLNSGWTGSIPRIEAPRERRTNCALLFSKPKAVIALAAYLLERKVEITGYPYGLVRVDPHAYNTREEIDLMLVLVKEFQCKETGK
jgi:hypothetical protein